MTDPVYTNYPTFEPEGLKKNIEGKEQFLLFSIFFFRIDKLTFISGNTLREKEKLLGTSNFSFSLNVFFFNRIEKLPSILTTSEIVVFKLYQFETFQNLLHDNGQVSRQSLRNIRLLRTVDLRRSKIPLYVE